MALIGLIEGKYDSLTTEHRKLVNDASEAQLKRWLQGILSATTLEKLLHS